MCMTHPRVRSRKGKRSLRRDARIVLIIQLIGNPRQDFRAEPHLLSLERENYYTCPSLVCQEKNPLFHRFFVKFPGRIISAP